MRLAHSRGGAVGAHSSRPDHAGRAAAVAPTRRPNAQNIQKMGWSASANVTGRDVVRETKDGRRGDFDLAEAHGRRSLAARSVAPLFHFKTYRCMRSSFCVRAEEKAGLETVSAKISSFLCRCDSSTWTIFRYTEGLYFVRKFKALRMRAGDASLGGSGHRAVRLINVRDSIPHGSSTG